MVPLQNRLGFRSLLLGLLLGILVPLFAAWSWISLGQVRESVQREERGRLTALVSTVAPRLSGDAHEDAWRAAPARDAIRDWSAAPAPARDLRAALREAHDAVALTTPMYTLRLRDGRRAAVEAEPDRVHPAALEFVLTTSEEPYWGHELAYLPSMAPTLLHGEVCSTPIYEDAHGSWVSAFAPVLDGRGEVVAMLEADVPVDVLLARASADVRPLIVTFASLLLALVVGLSLVARAVGRDLSRLSASAKRFGRGDYRTPVPASLAGRELVDLARALEQAREQIASDVARREELGQREARARATAEEASQAKSRFLRNMSHEVRTPLNGLIGLTGLLADTELAPDQRRMVATLRGAGRTLLRVVDDVLDVTRLKEAELQLAVEPFDPRTVVSDAAELFRSEATKKGLALEVVVGPGTPTRVRGDEARMRQVLTNLVANAVKFTEEGSVVTLVRPDVPGALRFEVRDTGPGISTEHREQLFEPFSQVDESASRRHGGAGLGLALSAELVARMGGRLELESTPGEGSTFSFTLRLPVVSLSGPSVDEVAPALPAPPRSADPAEAPLVLVVEDNPVNQMVTRRQVERLGYRCILAENGRVALQRLNTHRVAVVLMDGQMPEMDGYEATRCIRARDDDARHVPIVGLSAHALAEHRRLAMDAGMDDYLTKPVQLEDLDAALRNARQGRTVELDGAA